MEVTRVNCGDIDINNDQVLTKAWSFIIPKYMKKCSDMTEKKGPGINVFKMIPKRNDEQKSNCEYHYITDDSPFWDSVIIPMINYEEIKELYDLHTHIFVAIQIPMYEDSTLGNIKAYLKAYPISKSGTQVY